MRRLLLLLTLILALFNVQAFAQIGLIVQLPPNANIQAVANHAGGFVVDVIPEASQFLLSVPAATNLLSDSDVHWKELNQGTTLQSGPRVGYLHAPAAAAADWYKTQPSFVLINLSSALNYSTGRSVVVADINSRVDYSHPALLGHLTSGYDFVIEKPHGVTALDESSASYLDESSASYLDESSVSYLDESSASYLDESSASYLDGQNPAYSHGTLTAGIIAAIAPDSMIMPLRAFDDNGASDLFRIARAIRYAVNHGAQVINLSFGTLTDSNVLSTAITYALERNVIVTASAGNNNTLFPQYPAAYPGVIAVAATNVHDVKAQFSNYGAPVVVDAPGVNIVSPFPGNLYGIVNGTSFSAPAVAGTAALLLSQSATGVASRINAGAINIDTLNPFYARQLGNGRIDILRSVQALQ